MAISAAGDHSGSVGPCIRPATRLKSFKPAALDAVAGRQRLDTQYGCPSPESSGYCLSYTEVLLNFLPFESVPAMVTVRILPSADTTPRPVIVTLSPFLLVNVRV